jgi:hypothetical protein
MRLGVETGFRRKPNITPNARDCGSIDAKCLSVPQANDLPPKLGLSVDDALDGTFERVIELEQIPLLERQKILDPDCSALQPA